MADSYDKPGNQQTLPSDTSDPIAAARVRQRASDDQAIAGSEKQLSGPAIEDKERNLSSGFGAMKTPEGAALAKIGAAAALNPIGSLARIKKVFWSTPGRKTASVAGIGGGVVGGIIGIVMVFLPALKIPSAVSMIEDRFFANTNQIGETVTERLITQYIIKKLIPGMITNKCTSSKVDRMCAHPGNANTYSGALYNAWRDGRIEKKLYDQFGFEVSQENGRWYISSNSQSERISLGEFDGSEDQRIQFERSAILAMNRTQARLAVREVFNKETGATRRQMRQAGRVLERKYGIPRNLFSARLADWEEQNVNDPVKVGRSIIHRNIIGYYSQSLALAMDCMMDRNLSCTAESIDNDGFKGTKFQTDLRAAALEYSSKFGSDSLDDVLADADSIKQNGLGGHLANKLVEDIPSDATKATIKIGIKAIPIVGWVDLAVVLGTAIDKAPEVYPLIIYGINSQQAVSTFALFGLARDEYEAGDTELSAYGALTQTLDASNQTDNGGTGAEDSPVLRAANGQQVTESVVCNDGNRVEGILCPEEKLVPDSAEWLAGFDFFSSMFSGGGVSEGLRWVWNNTVGWVLDQPGNFVGWVMTQLPGYDQAIEYAATIFKGITQYMVETFVPSMLSGQPSGARIMNTMEAGGAVLAQDLCESMGCQAVEPEVNAASSFAYQQQQQDEFNNKSLFARMFDTQENQSLVSKLALSTPTSTSGLASFATGIFSSNPFTTIANNLAGGTVAHADTASSLVQYYDALRVTTQGIPTNDPVFTTEDYEAYETQLNCSNPDDPNRMKQWASTAVRDWPEMTLNPEIDEAKMREMLESGSFAGSAQYKYTTTNGCLTMQSVASSNGCKYEESLCELEYGNSGSATDNAGDTSDTSGGSFGTSTDMRALAQQILDNSNITLGTVFDNPAIQIRNIANGTNTNNCNVSPHVMNLILYVAQTHKISVSSLNRYCADLQTASGSLSYHWKDLGGHAVDFDMVDGVNSTGTDPWQGRELEVYLAFLREIAPKLPNGAQLGQVQCRPSGSITTTSEVLQFYDSCNHIHISMPVYAY